jgi:hypothetical protein
LKDAAASPRSHSSDTNSFNNEEEEGGGGGNSSPSSLENNKQQQHEYENVEQGHARLAVEARSKLMSSAVTPRSRERRNSFRQAVDQFGRPYEQIWFKVIHNHLSVS